MCEPEAGTQLSAPYARAGNTPEAKNTRNAGVTGVHVSRYGAGTGKVPTVLPFEAGLVMPKTKQVAELTEHYNVEVGLSGTESEGEMP
jgi:hypothetical protein